MREYIRKAYQFNFETYKELEDFDNLILNMKHKTGIRRVDLLMKKALQELADNLK